MERICREYETIILLRGSSSDRLEPRLIERKQMKNKTKKTIRTINLGSGYIDFLKAVQKHRHLDYPEYKKKVQEDMRKETK